MAALRIVALGLSWYLVGVTTVSVLAHALRAARLMRLADALSVGPIRIVVQQALGVGLAAGVLATSVPSGGAWVSAAATQTSGATITASVVEPDASNADASFVASAGEPVTTGATEQLVPIPAPVMPAATPAPEPSTPEVVDDAAGRTVRVEAGDHLWGLAEADLVARLDGPPTEAQVLAHWERLIEANRDRLVVPSNPDLLHPGQVVVLPDVEVAP